MSPPDVLAVRLQELREKHTKPIRSMAVTSELIELHRNALSMYERGEKTPSAENLIQLADFFGVSLDDLVARKKF